MDDGANRGAILIHELKNLVASVQMNAIVLEGHVEAAGLPILRDIQAACDRMAVRSREFLDSEKHRLMSDVDVSTLVWNVGRSDLEALSEAGTGIELQIEEDCLVAGNAGDLRRLVTALAQNAAQADAKTIWLRVGVDGPSVVIEVRDNGRGIAKADLERVTEAGFTTKQGGTGHGLAMARGLVELHRGQLDVDSEVGVGTTVRVSLPKR